MTLFIVPHVAPHPPTTTANKQMNAIFWISCTDCDHWTVFLIAIQRKNNSPHVCPLIQPQLHKNFLLDKKKNKKKKIVLNGNRQSFEENVHNSHQYYMKNTPLLHWKCRHWSERVFISDVYFPSVSSRLNRFPSTFWCCHLVDTLVNTPH